MVQTKDLGRRNAAVVAGGRRAADRCEGSCGLHVTLGGAAACPREEPEAHQIACSVLRITDMLDSDEANDTCPFALLVVACAWTASTAGRTEHVSWRPGPDPDHGQLTTAD